MGYIKKYRWEILLWVLITIVYFSLRLVYLGRLPIFTDEAIYTRWAQIALNDASWRFISLTDGKQPLFVWAMMIVMKFLKDPLIAGRIISVFSGFFTLLGLWFLSFELFKSKKVAYFSSILYIFYPLAQVLDRMALMDSMVATFSVWALYFSILLVRKIRLDVAYTLGFAAGLGALTKSSNFFSMYMLPFTFLLFDFKKKNVLKRFLNWGILALFAVVVAQILYNILRLSPLFEMIATKNATFVYPFSEWVVHPFTFFVGNLNGLIDWLFGYLKISYLSLIILSLIFIVKYPREKILLFLYFLAPFVALALFGRVIFPRFIFFMSLYLIPLAAWALFAIINATNKRLIPQKSSLIKITAEVLIILIFIFYPAYVSFSFARDPINAPIPGSDSRQYVNNWSAGWGVKETVDFLKEKAKSQKIFIGTEGTFGLMPEALELYLVQNKNVVIKGYWPIKDEIPKEALDYAQRMPVYFVFYQPEHQVIPKTFPLKLVFKKQAGNSQYYYRLFQVILPK